VDRSIVDKEVSIGPNAIVGVGSDMDTANRQEPGRLNTGITVVGKRAVIPANVRLGRNVKILEEVRPADFGGRRVIASGGTVEHRQPKGRERAVGPGVSGKSRDGEPMAARMTAAGKSGRS
jgi:acetyltransferase-like isoleucine patch superfamily enzyme